MQYGAHLPTPVEELAPPQTPMGRIAPREVEERREVSFQQAQPLLRAGVAAVWHDALSTFSAQSAAILFFALIGFAAPVIIGNWLYTSAKLSEYAHTRAIVTLCDRPALNHPARSSESGYPRLVLCPRRHYVDRAASRAG